MTARRPLEGRSGLITGAAGGLGRATAIAMAQAGAAVVVSDLPARREAGEETVAQVARHGGDARFVACDVSVAADCERLVDETVAAYGSLDFAHNNAAVGLKGPVAEFDEADYDRTVAVNLKGVWLGMKYELRQMVSQGGGGAIVNTSSAAGLVGFALVGVYSATKHGVVGLTKTAAAEYAEAGIRVNAICPGVIRTTLLERLTPEEIAAGVAGQAIKRPAEPHEIAAAVVWLCSDEASFVTGAALPVDGGATAA